MDYSDEITGDSVAATAWVVTSSLPLSSKQPLLAFIRRFSTLSFYRDDSAHLDAIENEQGITLPQWLREIRQTFAFVAAPNFFIPVRFDQHARRAWREIDTMWYLFGLRGYANRQEQALLESIDEMRPYPVGEEETSESTLAINLADEADQRVYEFSGEYLSEDAADGLPLRGSVRAVFSSYAEMFGHITALQFVPHGEGDGTGEILHARD